MSIYKLDETPDTYISAMVEEGSYIFRMYTFKGESNNSFLRDIDLRKDKLIIYGTEIQDSVRENLHTSLLLRSNDGRIYVDCNGACYISVTGRGVYRPIQNVIFDWSPFGIFVPNSINYALRKQQQQKDEELTAMSSQLEFAKGEAVTNKDGWEALKKETEKLTCQLSDCQKEELNKGKELQKVYSQLSIKEFELEAMKIKFELSKEELKQFQRDRVSDFNKMDMKSMELLELQKVQNQLSSANSELNSTKKMLDFSKEQLLSSEKENKDVKVKLQSLQDQVFVTVSELQSTKIELTTSNKNILELESQLLTRRKENEDVVTELKKVQNELSSSDLELQLAKSRLECSHKKMIKLEEQVTMGEKVQDQLSLIVNELQSIKVLLDFTAKVKEDRCSYDECFVINKAIEIVDDK